MSFDFIVFADVTSTITVTSLSMSEAVASSSGSLQLVSSSAAVGETEQGGADSAASLPQYLIITGMVVGVVLIIVCVTSAFLALACYKMKVSKRYIIETVSKHNGKPNMYNVTKHLLSNVNCVISHLTGNHVNFVNHSFMAKSSGSEMYDVPMGPVPIAVGEYAEVCDIQGYAAVTRSEPPLVSTFVANQALEVSHDEGNEYDFVLEPAIPTSAYHYVTTLVSFSNVV